MGTETFDSITTSYYRGGAVSSLHMRTITTLFSSFPQGIIIVYDISTLQSFNQLIKWINYVQIVS